MRPVLFLELKKLPEGLAHQGNRPDYSDLPKLFDELEARGVQIAQVRWVSLWSCAHSCYASLRRFIRKNRLPYIVREYGINVYLIRQKT